MRSAVDHLVLTIFHVADLHLFVEQDGTLRPPNEYARSVRTSRWIAKTIRSPSSARWSAVSPRPT